MEDGLIQLDGENTETQWSRASCIDSFSNPWNKAVNPETRLSFVRDSQNLYFFFEAEDTDLVVESDFAIGRDVEKEDRVELFFSRDPKMNEYFCFEIDPRNRILSYRARHYRKFQFEWPPPTGFVTAARIHSGGYCVEGAIPLRFLDGLRNDDGTLYFGAYRAEFSKKDDGATVENWLTWIDPQTSFPDFHVPQSLGILTSND